MNLLHTFASTRDFLTRAVSIFALFSLAIMPAMVSAQEYTDQELSEIIRSNLEAEEKAMNQDTANQVQGPISAPPPGTVSCFNHYTFGSVEATVLTSVGTVVTGSKATFSGSIKNNNPYPVVDGKLIMKVFKISETGEKNIQGPDVVGEYEVKKDISIIAKQSIPYKFEWQVPSYLEAGRYKVATFFVAGDKFNLLGLTFTDDIIGNSAEFTVASQEKKGIVRFDKANVQVAGEKYYFAAYPPVVPATGAVEVKATLTNTTKKAQSIPVMWKLYSWDAQQNKNMVQEFEERVTVPAGESVEAVYRATDTNHPVYYVSAEAKYQDTSSILGIRFLREGKNTLRINFPAVKQYPIVKGQQTELFSCLHATSDLVPPAEGKIVLSLLDAKGKTVHSYTYSGLVTAQMMGVLNIFVPTKNMDTFVLKAELFKGGELVDEAIMQYSCEKLNPLGPCTREVSFPWWGYVASLIILIIIGLFMKKRNVPATLLVLCLAVFATPSITEAKEVQWNTVVREDLYIRDIRDGINKTQLTNPNITVTYKAEISKATGEVLTGGEDLPVGTDIRLRFIPHASEHIYWFGTGSSWDSPYGAWGVSTTPPPATCLEKDLVFKDGWGSFKPPMVFGTRNHYFPLVITPPTKSLSLENVTCGTVNPAGVTNCEVTGAGPVKIDFNFSSTNGQYYYRRAFEVTNPNILRQREAARARYAECQLAGANAFAVRGRCSEFRSLGLNATPAQIEAYLDQNYYKLFSCFTSSPDISLRVRGDQEPFILNVPASTIEYTFTGSDALNQPPATPTISGPLTGSVGQAYEFAVVSTDADGDQVKYGIGWLGTEAVTQWSPAIGFVDQNIPQREIKTWTAAGTYEIKAMAQDDKGADSSGWATHTIVITEAPVTDITCSPSPTTADVGSEITWTATLLTGNPALYTFAWTGAVSGFTQSVARRYTDQGLKTARITATGEGRTISTECTINITDPTNGCVPGTPNCLSCGPTVSVAESIGLNVASPGLCATDANLITSSFAVRPTEDRWVWTCQAPTQTYPQACAASCAVGTQYCPQTGTCDRNCDFCPNIPGAQSNRTLYTIDNAGDCITLQDAAIRYFRFNPDTSNSACSAYWDVEKTGPSTVTCQIGSMLVPETNPSLGGQPTFTADPGRRHTLTCAVSADDGTFIKNITSVARCYRLGEVREN